MKEDVQLFIDKCLICKACRDYKVKTILASQLHANQCGMILHYDFLYIQKGNYILIIKDDFSNFVEFFICDSASHHQVVDALLWWNSRYSLRPGSIHISDRGTHFKNSVLKELQQKLGIDHRFTAAYSPKSNGTVEVVCRLFLKLLRVLELEFATKDWESLVPLIQSTLNLNGSPSLGDMLLLKCSLALRILKVSRSCLTKAKI